MGMTAAGAFSEEAFRFPALAVGVGPFPQREFLSAWWEAFGQGWELLVVSDQYATLPLMRSGMTVQFVGDSDLTDYHSPLGSDLTGLVGELSVRLAPGVVLDLDSLPEEAANPLTAAVTDAGLEVKLTEQTTAMVLELPSSIEAYREMIGKKERHELARKRRRYEERIGPVTHQTHTGAGFGFEEFVRLHRAAGGEKGAFMTGDRYRFFSRLARQPGWRVDLLEHAGRATACVFGWTDGRDYYLYNASYDPELHNASPGQVLLSTMIEVCIAAGCGRFDFLKGDEQYKARLGAEPRPLYRVEASC
jgi:CelD/BcsL family acetyltransferase involved in cellulose biosynthesis